MEKISLNAIAREQATRAAAAASGRSAQTVYGGYEHALRQTVLARLRAHHWMSMKARGRLPSRFCGDGSG
jgi:hypothetical protein